MEDFGQFADAVDTHMPLLVSNVETALAVDAQALLGAETNTMDVNNGAWSLPSSTPQEDIQAGLRANVPGADLCILGVTAADNLKLHADFKAGVAFYADRAVMGSGGVAGTDAALGAVLRDKFGFSEVIVARWKRNTANEGQARVLGYVFDNFFWAGNKGAFQFVKQPTTDSMPRFTNNVRAGNAFEMYYKRVGDLIRPGVDNGVRAINI